MKIMDLIAHRGASLVKQENSVESLEYAAHIGASATECDIRQTSDGVFVIFHDDSLERLTGEPILVKDLTYCEMKEKLAEKNYALLTFEELARRYREKTPILLHIKFETLDDGFVNMLEKSGLPFICGVVSPQAANKISTAFSKENVLAFMPDYHNIGEFVENGAGIIRLWEPWLSEIKPMDVKMKYDVKVWVMCRDLSCTDETSSMNGSPESLDFIQSLSADGALLNDIELGIRWKTKQEKE